MKICLIPYYGNELNNKAFNDYNNRWTNFLKDKLEMEGHSIATYDINTIEQSDVIISSNNVYFQNNRYFLRCYNAKKLGQTIHIDYEPPSADCRIHNNKGLKKLSKLFKVLVTYNDDVINNNTIVKGCIGDYQETELEYQRNFNDRKFLCMIANYRVDLLLFGQYKDELYSKRKEAVDFFQRKCPNDFDLYGSFWPDESKKCLIGPIERKNKLNILSQYKFIISYDSIHNQRGYISEKIFDCFKAKIVPIYWGADNITDYIPKDCFIDKRDFNTYNDLCNYLNNITEIEYEKKILNIEKYLKSEKYLSLFTNKTSANIIYNLIMKEGREIKYKKASYILEKFEKKRLSNYKYGYDNYYYNDAFHGDAGLFEIDKIKNEYCIIFPICLSKNYKPVFFVRNKNKLKFELEYNFSPGIGYNSVNYNFFISYNFLYLHKKLWFFIVDKNSNIKLPITIDKNPYKVKIYYDIENRVIFKKNRIKIIKTFIFYRNYVIKIIKKIFMKIKNILMIFDRKILIQNCLFLF